MEKRYVLYGAESNINTSLIFVPPSQAAFEGFLHNSAAFLERNGLEVIVGITNALDPDKVLQGILKFPFINWKAIQVDTESVTVALMSCVSQAVKANFMILNPLSRLYDTTWEKLTYYAFHHRQAFFVVMPELLRGNVNVPPDIIFCNRQQFSLLGNPDSSIPWPFILIQWVRKLQCAGVKSFRFNDHPERKCVNVPLDPSTVKNPHKIFYPHPGKLNGPSGNISAVVLFDWSKPSYGYERSREYLQQFRQVEIKENCFERQYRVIVLLQTYNEMKNMPAILQHLEKYSDGIIMLDDESTDGTYEQAISDKLLLKVQKKRQEFDDIGNRNILLNLVSFFDVQWIYTMDADERLDPRYDDIFGVTDTEADVLSFAYINLWNSPETYRVDYSTSENQNGIFYRKRMFRNIGRSQIYLLEQKKLHFNPVPMIDNFQRVRIMILHYGTLENSQRKNKLEFYLKEDSSQAHYDTLYKFLADGKVVLDKVENVKL